jgi:hypothetical protein
MLASEALTLEAADDLRFLSGSRYHPGAPSNSRDSGRRNELE